MAFRHILQQMMRAQGALTDPYWSNTSLLVKAGATTITDATGKTVSLFGNTSITSSIQRFGQNTIALDGSGDYFTIPDSSDFNFGGGDFTLDIDARWSSVGNACFFQQSDSSAGGYILKWTFYFTGSQLVLDGHNPASTPLSWIAQNFSPQVNTWYHIRLIRAGNTFSIYANGNQVGSSTTVTTALPNSAGALYSSFFYDAPQAGLGYMNGYFFEPRITKGLARSGSEIKTAPWPTA